MSLGEHPGSSRILIPPILAGALHAGSVDRNARRGFAYREVLSIRSCRANTTAREWSANAGGSSACDGRPSPIQSGILIP